MWFFAMNIMNLAEPNFESDLPPIDFMNLRESIECKLIIEIFHNLGAIPDRIYYTRYLDNAEIIERDMEVWKNFQELDEIVYFRK
jgi:hypothetical protein